jgi:hypothetical protein
MDAKWIDISEGNEANDSTEVFGNIQKDTNIITNASYRLKDGEEVK